MFETRNYIVNYFSYGDYVRAVVTARSRKMAVEIVSKRQPANEFKLDNVAIIGKDEGVKVEYFV